MSIEKYQELEKTIDGEVHTDSIHLKLYATDASVYRSLPEAIVYPKTEDDVQKVVVFANKYKIGLVARAAGTSLAGQCIGKGIILDISKYMTQILEVDPVQKTVRVQPGVIRDELNLFLKPYGLFFGPNTSTSNRCMIGGMLGNNSSGTTSIQYGVTRDKVLLTRNVLSSGEIAVFAEETKNTIENKIKKNNHTARIYRFIHQTLSQESIRNRIYKNFPDPSIHRRNTGYAIDLIARSKVYEINSREAFNLNKLLSGSEGTLAITTEIILQLDVLPPDKIALVVPHYTDYTSCLSDVVLAMKHDLFTCEMLDQPILDRTAANTFYRDYRSFLKNAPQAILMLEVRAHTELALQNQVTNLLSSLESSGNSYHISTLYEEDVNKALALRKAGLGLLGNIVGDTKAVACIEDTAVPLEVLPQFIEEFQSIMKSFNQEGVYYAHAGAGELHIRPLLNLKKSKDIAEFSTLTGAIAALTKKYRGSFSGEHGDGIVRSSFISLLIGDENYSLLQNLKKVFDPNHILNPGKIVDAWPIDKNLRYEPDRLEPQIHTKMDFKDYQGILRMSENCNGSGDCRKTHLSKANMCPSYQATKMELHSTRGRANVLREVLTHNTNVNRFDSKDLKEAMSLCLSCKACQSECPSNVDITAMKTEFLYQYQQIHGTSLAQKLLAYNTKLLKWAAVTPKLSNAIFESKLLSLPLKKISHIAPERQLPRIDKPRLNTTSTYSVFQKTKVVLILDEFTALLGGNIADDALFLLNKLGYETHVLSHIDTGRSFLSKGFLDEAQREIDKNLTRMEKLLTEDTIFIGIEPSAILSFKDEYLRLSKNRKLAQKIADKTYLIESFLANEIRDHNWNKNWFTDEVKQIKIHNHCHQKAMGFQKDTFDILNYPEGYIPTILSSGCCGMAGSFGFEKESYQLSLQIAELHLAPAIRKASHTTLIAANGISCRQQIEHTTKRIAQHPISILKEALRK